VTPIIPRTRRSALGSIGVGEALFASAEERRFADAIEAGLQEVERGLIAETAFADDVADATGRYLLQAGGKRVRPVLTLLTAQLGAGSTPEVLVSAQIVELTHLASLYHDDVMDEAQLRRGVPSAQSVWGNSVAILTGDLLFARASALGAELGEEAIALHAGTFQRLVLGQLHETIGPRDDEDPVEHYLQVLADKTGALISTAAIGGVLFSGAPREYRDAVGLFGERIGVAFQLVDDVLDLSPSRAETGKAAGTDLRAGVVTLPLLYLRERARTDPDDAALLTRIERMVDGGHADGPAGSGADAGAVALAADDADAVVARLREHPVTGATLAEAERWAADAVEALAPLPDGPVRKALTRFARTVVERRG